jgi:hypothetical protein
MNWVITNLGLVKASYKLELYVLFKAYVCKALRDPLFHSTLPIIHRYMAGRDLGLRTSAMLTKRSYRESYCKHGLKAT